MISNGNKIVLGLVAVGFAFGVRTAHGAVNWDEALVVGRTNGDKCFYKIGEEMVFTLELKGVKGEIPPGEFFLDWERTANDGKTEKGRAEAAIGKPLVIRTKLDCPGFVKVQANLVDKKGKRVPKKHMWEKRVFFQGGAGVEVDKMPAWPEPKDFDAHWAENRRMIETLPLKVLERTPIPCQNPRLNLWRMKLNAPDGYRPATGYLAIPKNATAAHRVKATGMLSGYYNFPERCPKWFTNSVDGIRMYINRHGCDVDQPESYYKQFYERCPLPQSHFRGMALRGLQMFRYLKTLPEWNGKELVATGSSGGAMQSLWMAMAEPSITSITITAPGNADVFGFKYGRATCGLSERKEDLNYYDICNVAKRVKCPVVMTAGLGDYTCPPAGMAIVYRNLRCQKQITWCQGCTHGWWPSGMKKETWSSGPVTESRAGVEELTAGTGGADAHDPLGKMFSSSSARVADLVLIGDSTLTPRPGEDYYPPSGSWGDALTNHFAAGSVCRNYAIGGRTVLTTLPSWGKSLAGMHTGDFVIVQFGINDANVSKFVNEAKFKETLRKFVDDIRSRGAIPVLCGPIANGGYEKDAKADAKYKIDPSRNTYRDYTRAVAEEKHADFVDMTALTAAENARIGRDGTNARYRGTWDRPDGKTGVTKKTFDTCHPNKAGARRFAELFIADVTARKLPIAILFRHR